MVAYSILQDSITLAQLSSLFTICFSRTPWDSKLSYEENSKLLSKVREMDGYIEGGLIVDDSLIGAYIGMKVDQIPYEFEKSVGYAEFLKRCKMIYPEYSGNYVRNIWNIFISPIYQGKGYGNLLLLDFEKKVTNNGGKYTILSTLQNGFQREWYSKKGYIPFRETINFGHSLVFMIKKI